MNWFSINHVGGIEVYIHELIEQLKKKNISVLFVHGDRSISSSKDTIYSHNLDRKIFDAEIDSNLIKKVVDFNPDIIHIHNPHIYKQELIIRAIKTLSETNKKTKIFASVHNLNKDLGNVKESLSLYNGKLLTCSLFMQESLKELFSIKSSIIPYCIESPKISLRNKSNSLYTKVLQPTRFSNWKGTAHSLNAIAQLFKDGYKDLRFTHAGIENNEFYDKWDPRWDKLYPNLYNQINALIDKNIVSFIKYPVEDTYSVFREFNLIVHPTIGLGYEGDPYPLALQQARILNMPIIASDSGGIPEIMRNYKYGHIIRANDDQALINEIRNFLNKKEMFEIENIEKFDQHFLDKYKDSVDKLLYCYEKS